MKKTKLIKELEVITHNQRWEYLINLGQNSTEKLNELFRTLSTSEVHYERLISLMYAHGSKDSEIIFNILKNNAISGMGSSFKLASQVLNDTKISVLVNHFPTRKRNKLFAALVKEDRIETVDNIIANLNPYQINESIVFASDAFIEDKWDLEQIESFTSEQFSQFTKRHPQISFNHLSASENTNTHQQSLLKCGLICLYSIEPELGLKLIQGSHEDTPIETLELQRYMLIYPQEIADYILNHPKQFSINLPVSALRKLEDATLVRLSNARRLPHLIRNLNSLKPSQRVAVYQQQHLQHRNQYGILPFYIIKTLPQDLAIKEAKIALKNEYFSAFPNKQIPYTSVLHYDEAYNELKHAIKHADAEIRKIAITSLIETTRFDSDHLREALDLVVKRNHEQDPVRLAMIQSLTSLPVARWTLQDLVAIESIINDTFDARDASMQTYDNLIEWVLRLMPYHGDFVVQVLPKLVAKRGTISSYKRFDFLSSESIIKLDTQFKPLINVWIRRDETSNIIALIRLFGLAIRKANDLQELNFVTVLKEMTRSSHANTATTALNTLSYLKLNTVLEDLIPRLLLKDSSWIKQPVVSDYLSHKRQDLLNPFLPNRRYKGLFKSNISRDAINYKPPYFRWTARQQEIYQKALFEYLSQKRLSVWLSVRCITQLGLLPSSDKSGLIKLAQANNDNVLLRDKAIEALGHSDGLVGLDLLQEALKDDRDRVAIYALRRKINTLSESDALSIVTHLKTKKVSVKKEIVRLIGTYHSNTAYDYLMNILNEKDLHTDIHIAVIQSFNNFLNQEAVWEHILKIGQSENLPLVQATIMIPSLRLNNQSETHFEKHLTNLLKHENIYIRALTINRLIFKPITTDSGILFEALVHLLNESKDTCTLVSRILINTYATSPQLISTLAAIENPLYVQAIVNAFKGEVNVNQRNKENAVAYIIANINNHHMISLMASLAFFTHDPYAILSKIASNKYTHPGMLTESTQAIETFAATQSHEKVIDLEHLLRNNPDPILRRLGVSVLTHLINQYGWLDAFKIAYKQYQKDDDTWVFESSALIETPEDLAL